MPLAALLVANPTAQSGKNAARIAQAQTLLDRAGVVHTLLPTLPAGATVGAVSEALRGGDWRCVIAMGGDGTFSEVARGLHASGRAEDIPLAMLPTGTANDQGRSFGLSADPKELARNVAVLARATRRASTRAGSAPSTPTAGSCRRRSSSTPRAGASPRARSPRATKTAR
jgi:diacylglycerol kinase family enzyme